MNSNISVKVKFKVHDTTDELIFPNNYTIRDFMSYIRNISNFAVIVKMSPTSKKPTI